MLSVRTEKIKPTGEIYDIETSARPFIDKSLSPRTRANYTGHLKQFFSFFRGKRPEDITTTDVIAWRDHLRTKKGRNPDEPISEATVAVKLATVRSFFEYLRAEGLIQRNPASVKLVPPPQLPDELKGRALDLKQVSYVLKTPDRRNIIGARDYAIIMLMLRCFFRVSEVVNLKEQDFFVEDRQWRVRTKIKGGKEKVTPVPNDVKAAVDEYHLLDRDHRQFIRRAGNKNPFVFQSVIEKKPKYNLNLPLSSRQVWVRVKHIGKLSGIGDLTPHDFRRTAITRALDMKESYRRVMNAARLSNLRTVQRYDHHRKSLDENSINNLNYDE